MATLAEIARAETDLDAAQIVQLQHLTHDWSLIADLSFADIVLFGRVRDAADKFVVLAQIRPTTGPTLYRADRVGQVVGADARPLLTRAFATGEIVDGGLLFRDVAQRIRVLDVPVNHRGRTIAVLSRQFSPDLQRSPGDLELRYFTACRRIDRMIAEGTWPYAEEDPSREHLRVGDGVMTVDGKGRIVFQSPNAVSAFLRLGLPRDTTGTSLEDLDLGPAEPMRSLHEQRPLTFEIERGPDTTVLIRCLPLIEGDEVTGGLFLVRDVSELRRRDRLLLSKDATIAEIHHRVKNNLQTVSSLLSLQGRRVAAPEAKAAIEESARRIRSIAVVHEILSQEVDDETPFSEILGPLLRQVGESLVSPDRPVQFVVEGDAGWLPSATTTHLALVLSELLQNVVDHAYPVGTGAGGRVIVGLDNDGAVLRMSVTDDGVGVQRAVADREGLGLTIVRNLVTRELGGTMAIERGDGPSDCPGTRVDIEVPLAVALEK